MLLLQLATDSTAIAGPPPPLGETILPLLVAVLASALMALGRHFSAKFRELPAGIHSSILAVGSVLLQAVGEAIQFQAPTSLSDWTEVTLRGFLAALSAHLIYRRGKGAKPPTGS